MLKLSYGVGKQRKWKWIIVPLLVLIVVGGWFALRIASPVILERIKQLSLQRQCSNYANNFKGVAFVNLASPLLPDGYLVDGDYGRRILTPWPNFLDIIPPEGRDAGARINLFIGVRKSKLGVLRLVALDLLPAGPKEFRCFCYVVEMGSVSKAPRLLSYAGCGSIYCESDKYIWYFGVEDIRNPSGFSVQFLDGGRTRFIQGVLSDHDQVQIMVSP